jgi:hypothetical protein
MVSKIRRSTAGQIRHSVSQIRHLSNAKQHNSCFKLERLVVRKLRLISIAGLLFMTACKSARNPSTANFTNAINQYLAKHGHACTSIGRQFPIDIPASAPQARYGFGPQLVALQQAGLVSETDTTTVVHGMLDALDGSDAPKPVRQYQLTAKGLKYFQQLPGTFGQTGGLCYGQKTIDSVIKWSEPVTMNRRSQSEVTYTYKIVNLAAWAERSDVQQAFPDIGSTVNGTSKATQTVGLRLTDNGWEVVGS